MIKIHKNKIKTFFEHVGIVFNIVLQSFEIHITCV
jgi:hypothetical protein